MHLVSLISDYGTKEYYLAYLKATLYSEVPEAKLLDITHDVPMDDLGMAAYQLRSAMVAFPPNAIHLVCINENLYSDLGILIARKKDQWIVAPNNGFLYLLYDDYDFGPVEHLCEPSTVGRAQALAKVIYALCHQYGYVERLAEPQQAIQKYNINPIISHDQIRTKIFHIDHYGNLILNVTQELFEEASQGRPFQVEFRKHTYSEGLLSHMGQVEIGELGCLFTQGGYMMIYAFQDRAEEILDVRKNEIVNIRFNSPA